MQENSFITMVLIFIKQGVSANLFHLCSLVWDISNIFSLVINGLNVYINLIVSYPIKIKEHLEY